MNRSLRHTEQAVREALDAEWYVYCTTDDNKFRVQNVITNRQGAIEVQDVYGAWYTLQEDDLLTTT